MLQAGELFSPLSFGESHKNVFEPCLRLLVVRCSKLFLRSVSVPNRNLSYQRKCCLNVIYHAESRGVAIAVRRIFALNENV